MFPLGQHSMKIIGKWEELLLSVFFLIFFFILGEELLLKGNSLPGLLTSEPTPPAPQIGWALPSLLAAQCLLSL